MSTSHAFPQRPVYRKYVGPAAVALLAASLAAWAEPPADDAEEIPPRVLRELKATPVECPEDVGSGWSCGAFRGSFSRLKFVLEVELSFKDFEARPLGAWKLAAGRYHKAWEVHGNKVTMLFDRKTSVVMVSQGPLEPEDLPQAPDAAEGDDDDDDGRGGDDDKKDDDAREGGGPGAAPIR